MNRGKTIADAIARLASSNLEEREAAHEELVRVGRPAVWFLIQTLQPPSPEARREVLRVLVDLADPDATDTFVKHLEDEDPECRWLAAEGLIRLGKPGLQWVLQLLSDYPGSEWLRRGAHHVLDGFRKQGTPGVQDVLDAFQSDIPNIDVPKAALHLAARLEAGAETSPGAG